MKTLLILALAVFSATAFAQTPAPDGEKLTSSEELALKYVAQEFQQAQQDLAKLNSDVAKAHPGYTLNANTGSLAKIESLAPKPEPAPVKAEPKK